MRNKISHESTTIIYGEINYEYYFDGYNHGISLSTSFPAWDIKITYLYYLKGIYVQ